MAAAAIDSIAKGAWCTRRSQLAFEEQDAIFRRLCSEVHITPLQAIGDPSKNARRPTSDRWTVHRALVVSGLLAAGLSWPQCGRLMHRHHSFVAHLKKVLARRIAKAPGLARERERLESLGRWLAETGVAKAEIDRHGVFAPADALAVMDGENGA